MVSQTIIDIPEICFQLGVRYAVISPGSRSAPLTLAFARYNKIINYVIPDERSAAFVGLGIAQKTKSPVVLICTSGSAGYNFAPAVAEAFFQQIPLLVFTADRPPEWIDQLDGQTIHQKNIYGSHVKKSFDFPDSLEHNDSQWYGRRIISEAVNLSISCNHGPVHVNFPFREPFYPESQSSFDYNSDIKVIRKITPKRESFIIPEEVFDLLKSSTKVLFLCGQQELNNDLCNALDLINKETGVVIMGDILSNIHSVESSIRLFDNYLNTISDELKEQLIPDVLITTGKSIISKNLKLFLREYSPKHHIHIQECGVAADTFQSLTMQIDISSEKFVSELRKGMVKRQIEVGSDYQEKWQDLDKECLNFYHNYSFGKFTQLESLKHILSSLPIPADLHLANSMPVRWANFIGIDQKKSGLEVFCNRGTSGIDGSVSTALGNSLVSEKLTFLITGDLAFFYDRNAFWNNYSTKNLRVILLNNHAGGIFGLIKGPGDQPELEEYFETRQPLNAKLTAEQHNLVYSKAQSIAELEDHFSEFISDSDTGKILELEFDNAEDKSKYKEFRKKLSSHFQS